MLENPEATATLGDVDAHTRELGALLARRIEATEREQRRLRRLGYLLAGGLVTLLLLLSVSLTSIFRWQAPGHVADALQARRFVLADENGLTRGVMEVTQDGGVRLTMRDGDARERMRLTLLRDGSPGLTLADRDGHPRVVLGVLPDQSSNLVFADGAGRTRAVLGLGPDQGMSLLLADGAGVTRANLNVAGEGSPVFTLTDDAPEAAPADTAGAAADSTPR